MKIVWSVIVAAAAVACASVFFAGAKHVAEDARPGGNAAPSAIQIRTMLPTAATQPPATPPSAATRDIAAKLDQTTFLAPHDPAELIRIWTRADPAAALLWILRTPERRATRV